MVRHRSSSSTTLTSRSSASSSPSNPSTPSTPSRRNASPSYRAPRASTLLSLSLVLLASLGSLVRAQAMFEPAGDQVLFGMWYDSQAGWSDTPSLLNARLGLNVPVLQIAQVIPLPKYNYTTGAGGAAPENLIELSETDAAVFLTVYPSNGFAAVSNDDFSALGSQIAAYHALNRTVFLRYAPEMQGNWNAYGNQPVEFIASWTACYNAVKVLAPETIMVWAPNTPQGYPYGQTLTATVSLAGVPGTNTAADQAALDTNNDGQLTAADNALSPYYPGDDLVDWIGLSLYYKGPTSARDAINVAQTPGYCGQAINGLDPGTGDAITPWYSTYCAQKPTKACMLAESGAAWHVNDATAAGSTSNELQLSSAWINDCITNSSFLTTFPRLKLIMNFEYEKVETSNQLAGDDLRDYRLTNDTAVLDVLKAGFATETRYSWANFRAKPTSISSAGAPPPLTNSLGSTIVQAITQTTRARPTTFPSLFGLSSDASKLRAQLIELAAMTVCGVAGGWAVMRMI